MNKTSEVILIGENLHKRYAQGQTSLHVLKGVSLKVNEGEMISIVGPSGAGKSTLLHILGGLDAPSEGEVIIGQDSVYELNDQKRAQLRNKKLGFIFQFYHLLAEFSALENVLIPAMIENGSKGLAPLQKKALSLLEQVGLKDRVHHKPQELSGGEQQRVAIARALINSPKVIFCDEPTGNLDSQTGEEIINLLISLNKENKQTLIIVTHDESISKLSHKTIFLKDGKVI